MKTFNSISSFIAYLRLVCDTRIIVSLIFVFCNFNFSTLHAQDCFPDIEPPVLICKKIDTLMLGWCGNEQVYASEFVNYTVDNCSKYVKITFDKEGKLEWIESFFLSIGLDTSNNFITIYAHDDAGNVSSCSSFCFPVYMKTYNIKCNILSDNNFYEESDKIQLNIKTEDDKLHQSSTSQFSNLAEFEFSISSISAIKSLDLQAIDKPFKYWTITTADLIEASRFIINAGRYSTPINYLSADTNCDGEINILDLYKTYQYILGAIVKDDCIGQPVLRFVDLNGTILGTEIPYSIQKPIIPTIAFCQRRDINRSLKSTTIPFNNPVSRITGTPIYWKTKNQILQKDQIYQIEFELSDSSTLFAMQGNFSFDPDLIELDTFYSNFLSSNYSNRSPNDFQWVWLNNSNPKLEHIFPKITFQIKAKADVKLNEAFIKNTHSISNMLVDAQGNASPLEIEFSKIIAGPKKELEELNLVVKTNLWNDDVFLIGKINTNTTGYIKIFNLAGALILNKAIFVTDGNVNEHIAIQQPGFYILQFESPAGDRKSIRFQKF